ncbi:ANM_collapsed_G0058580.mRNA.1.CDS.1 [Saccharomyces cerevisiae]|nr:ANM_collapsed_G0058580.mRNA.1.CDS.1 [Saccharomyces cerevisiae]
MSGSSGHNLETRINEYLSYLQLQVLNRFTEFDFRRILLEPFLNLLKQNSTKQFEGSAGPVDLLNEIVANVQNGDNYTLNNKQMRQHRKVRNKIAEGRLNFQEDHEMIDISFCKS